MFCVSVVVKEQELLKSLESDEQRLRAASSKPPSSLSTKILSTVQQTQQKQDASVPTATREVSPAARKVLAQLPDWSFMRARVLMFPIKDGVDAGT